MHVSTLLQTPVTVPAGVYIGLWLFAAIFAGFLVVAILRDTDDRRRDALLFGKED